MDRRAQRVLEAALGARVEHAARLGGGDINDAFRVSMSDGRVVFVKTNQRADPAMFPAEARGLEWLRRANALRVPEVISAAPELLALEHIEAGRPAPDHDERLGQGLADLHRFGAPSFGLDHDNFIGRLAQRNAPAESWPEFYRTRRLEPQLRAAERAGLAPRSLLTSFERLFGVLSERVGPPEPPARLHGDLWGGNLHTAASGEPCLIDPAVYGGHREMDLAMMLLFGGFGSRVFDAYEEAYPLAPGHEERVALYQLYPLLVHVNLFGQSYVGSVARALAQLI
ncbi:MAG: fructosamine kinase family protein [Polyangiaceae bacterium]|nr:fructosamine kinase family protein [Polyangiaceae bacterium]